MESTNSFNKGMDLDTNPLNLEKGKYREATNVRIVNDVGSTSFSVNNIKGNIRNLIIPSLPTFQKIEIIGITGGSTQTLTINGQIGTAFTTAGMTPESLFTYISNDAAYTLLGTQYNLYVGNSYLLIVPIGAFALTITTNDGTKISIDASFVPAQSNMEIIGSVNIRGDMYLFTTSNKTLNPGGHNSSLTPDASSVGQIWRYNYNKVSLVGTLTLIYNNYVDFSTYYAIPPTAVTGRYENGSIQRIYWTDNFNKLRSLNVVDPNSLAIDVSILDIRPSIDMDRPIMTDITNSTSSITAGVYQAAYRFKNNGGATTNFSELSDLVYAVASTDEHAAVGGSNFRNYISVGVGSIAKKITWTISNLDPDFDRIEVAVVYRASITDVPTVIIIQDEEISGTGNHTVLYDGTQTKTPMTLQEFLALSGAFTHCKTIGTKDNRLFVANVRNQLSEVEYDARAFRAKTSAGVDIYLTNNGVQTLFNPTTAAALAETEDTINDYTSPNAGHYKPGTAILGGAGVNISYEFYTQAIAADVDTNASGPFGIPDFVAAPWRHTNPDYTQSRLDLGVKSFSDNFTQVSQLIPTAFPNNINAGFKYPPYTSALRGFQRNEIYRFGIQFFDKSKNTVFVKWIGDIKMPDFFDSNPNSFYNNGVATGITDFKPGFVGNNSGAYDEAFVQSLGIKFTVNIPVTLTTLIDGYSIVRVKREEADKSIVSQGYIIQANGGPDGNLFTTAPVPGNESGNNLDLTAGSYAAPDKGFFVTPDLVDGALTIPAVNMTMKVKGLLNNVNTDAGVLITGGGDPYWMYKYYDFQALGTPIGPFNLQQCDYIGYAGNITDNATGVAVFNYDCDFAGADATVSQGIGNPAYYFQVSANIDYTETGGNKKFLVNIERTLTNQYGGNTYAARALNEYISCSHYRPVRNTAIPLVDTFNLFGGDIFLNMYDSCRWSKNWNITGRGVSSVGKFSTTFFFPVETIANTDLRSGFYMNKDFALNFDTGIEMKETYSYNSICSAQNDTKIFFPKPDPFFLNEEFDNRFYASEIKINGELSDSWGIFLANNYWDVEGTYGPINAMMILRDKMYFWQNRSFGIIQINPRAIVTDNNAITNSDLQIGTGLPLQRHDYLSTEIGLQHQWGLTKSAYKLFWMDVANKKFFTFAEGESITPESDVKGLFSYLNDHLKYNILTMDKPVYFDADLGINGIRAIYDFKYNQAIFTIHDGRNIAPGQSNTVPFTIAFDESLNAFTSFYSFFPKVYFGDGYKIFSTNPVGLSDIYMHDSGNYSTFYGTRQFTTLKFVVNDNAKYTKIFDNILFDCQAVDTATGINYNDDTWNSIRFYADYQNTDFQTLLVNNNIKRKERTWQMAVPRNRVLYTFSDSPDIFTDLSPTDKTYGERMRNKYMIVDMIYNNLNNRDLTLNNLRVLYRQSPR